MVNSHRGGATGVDGTGGVAQALGSQRGVAAGDELGGVGGERATSGDVGVVRAGLAVAQVQRLAAQRHGASGEVLSGGAQVAGGADVERCTVGRKGLELAVGVQASGQRAAAVDTASAGSKVASGRERPAVGQGLGHGHGGLGTRPHVPGVAEAAGAQGQVAPAVELGALGLGVAGGVQRGLPHVHRAAAELHVLGVDAQGVGLQGAARHGQGVAPGLHARRADVASVVQRLAGADLQRTGGGQGRVALVAQLTADADHTRGQGGGRWSGRGGRCRRGGWGRCRSG